MKIREGIKPKCQRQKGITLVALVVTIIVLLILAGVTISTIFNENGIISTAQKAADETKKAETISNIQLELLGKQLETSSGKLTLDQLEDVLKKYGEIQYEGEDITGVKVEGIDEIIKIEDVYTGTVTTAESEWTQNEDGSITDGKGNTLKIGDYVDYDCTTSNATYTSPASRSGYTGDQVFKVKEYQYGWRVLGVDKKTKQLQLISEDFVPLTGRRR